MRKTEWTLKRRRFTIGRASAAAFCMAAWAGWAIAPTLTHGAEITSTWNPAAIGDWSDGANWDTNPIVPNNAVNTFVVIINDGATTLDSAFTIDELTLSGGALIGGGSLTVNDQTTWSGGALGGVGATATLDFNGPTLWDGGSKGFAAVTVNLNGATTWSAGFIGSIEPPEGGTINNAGAFDLQDNLQLNWNSTQTPVFNNLATGSFTKSGGTGEAARIDATFNNSGVVDVNSGEMWFAGGGTSSGTFNVAAGASLDFSDYNQGYSGQGATTTTLDADAIVNASGTVIFTNLFGDANTDIFGQYDAADTFINPGPGGEVRYNLGAFVGSTIVGAWTLNSGTLVFQNDDTVLMASVDVNDTTSLLVRDNSTLEVSGNITVNDTGVIRLGATGNAGGIAFSGGVAHDLTGNGQLVFEGSGSSLATGFGDTLQIGPDFKIRGGGSGQISATGESVNQGTISADVSGQSLTVSGLNNSGVMEAINNGSLFLFSMTNTGVLRGLGGSSLSLNNVTNQASLSVTGGGNLNTINLQNSATGVVTINGGTLTLQSLWDNDGTINATNATVELAGVFNFSNVGTINRSGTTTVRVIGTLQNAAQVVALDNTTGSWTLATTGVIQGGTVAATGAAKLIVSGGELDGVILSTSPTFTSGASLLIENGIQLTGADLDLSNGGTIAASLSFLGPAQAIAGNGIVTLGVGSNINHSFGGTVTFGPGIAIEARHGTFNGGASGIVIQGVLNADGQGLTTNLVSLIDVTNTGDLNALDGVTLRMAGAWHNGGGNIDVINSTLLLAGPFTTADIGAINRTGTSIVRLATTLNNSAATLDLASAFDGDLQLRAGTIQGGSVVPGSPVAKLVVTGDVVGGGTLDGVTNLAANVVFDPATNGDTLTIRNSLTIANATVDMSGLGRIISFSGTNAQTLGGTGEILLNTASSNNIRNNSGSGAVVTFGPNIDIHGGGFSLVINGKSNGSAGGFINQGRIAVESAGSQMSISHLENQGIICNVAGSTLLIGDGFVQTAGKLKVDGILTRNTPGPLVIQGGSVSGGGSINASVSVGTASTPGDLQSDGMAGALAINGDLTVHPTSTLSVDLLGTIAGTCYDQYNVSGTVNLSGSTLDVDLDFAPIVLGQPFTIISNGGSDAIVGEFADLIDGAIFPVSFLTHTYQMQINYDGGSNNNDVVLTVTSIPATIIAGDVNFDGVVNIFDINLVSTHWNEMGPTGDANGDCIVNIFDINLISSHWGDMVMGGGGGTEASGIAATAVPEPATWLLAAAAVALLTIARRPRT